MKLFCPSCGAPLEFRYDDSFVRVCGSCRSAIARTDRGIDTLGQFADLAPAASGLSLWDEGRWQGRPFVLAGRAEYAHPAGGSWEEWFMKLADGRWAWLSHAHGSWAVTVESAAAESLPSFDEISVGMRLVLGKAPGVDLVVGERNAGSASGAEGELPFLFVPGSLTRFVDLSDDRGRFATLDYGPPGSSAPPTVYVGRRVTLTELGLRAADVERAGRDGPARAGERLACPNCGGSIELRVPDRSLSVTCSYCGSLLDCEGPLAILERYSEVQEGFADIPLGATGSFEGNRYTVTGRLRRRADFPGGFVEWDEYLLYAAAQGYRWLVCSRGHYSFVTPLAPGAVGMEGSTRASYRGRSFALFDRGKAAVTGVWGEFYWKVTRGEEVETADYISPPLMLSRESSPSELHWSLGVYQPIPDVQRAFGIDKLQTFPRGVAPHQPFRHRHWTGVAVALAAALFACLIIRGLLADSRQVYHGSFRSSSAVAGGEPSGAAPSGAAPHVFFTPSFELAARNNVAVQLSMPLENDWAYVNVDLVHEPTGEIRTYGAELSYYSGIDGGERWSEGNSSDRHVFGAGQRGTHLLRLEVQTSGRPMLPLTVTVAENVFVPSQLGWVLALIVLPGVLLAAIHYAFERERWSESDFAPGHYASGSNDD